MLCVIYFKPKEGILTDLTSTYIKVLPLYSELNVIKGQVLVLVMRKNIKIS